ncbi:MAG: hypothetical protein AAGA54_18830 [Myxococcota bacterium]
MRPTPQPGPVNDFFLGLRTALPEAETISQQNGLSIECGKRGWVTLSLLQATAEKVPLEQTADLVHLVPWVQDEDVCLRHIAVSAAVDYLEFDRNRLVVPNMHDPEHVLFREIMQTMRARLDRDAVPYDPKLFDSVLLTFGEADFARLTHGAWTQDIDRSTVNAYSDLEIDAEDVRVIQRHTTSDPQWPDHTSLTRIAGVSLHADGHYVVRGKWDHESDANGYEGERITPSQLEYSFLPAREGVLWWKGGNATRWTKLRRR